MAISPATQSRLITPHAIVSGMVTNEPQKMSGFPRARISADPVQVPFARWPVHV